MWRRREKVVAGDEGEWMGKEKCMWGRNRCEEREMMEKSMERGRED